MKAGRSLTEVMQELDRQNRAKKDFIAPGAGMRLQDDGRTFEIRHASSGDREVFNTTGLFHRQVASALGIPAKYYDVMQREKPGLLAENVNAWFGGRDNSYMVRSLTDGLGQTEQDSILKYLIQGGDLSKYGLSNAITRASQDVESYDRATMLEGIGWQVATMPDAVWREVNR